MKQSLFLGLTFFLVGCIKDYNSRYTATLTNKTQHSITILFYKGGVVYATDTIKLMPNQPFEFANGSQRGNLTVPGFNSKYSGGPNDSVIVIFDNLYKVSHYANTPSSLAPKHYLNSSVRNIVNPKSYRFVSTPISKGGNKNDHYYDFIEQDYLDAK